MFGSKKKQKATVQGPNWGYTFAFPEHSKWSCQLMPGTVIRPVLGKEPIFIHRWMQRLILGFIWKKDKPIVKKAPVRQEADPG